MSIDVPRVRHDIDDVEDARPCEPADEILALGTSIGIDDHDRHVAHVSRRRVAKNRKLEDRRDENDAEDARVLAQLDDLFPHDKPDPSHDLSRRLVAPLLALRLPRRTAPLTALMPIASPIASTRASA